MPIRSIPNWTEKYYLLVFDKHGREVEEGGALLSGRIGADHPDATDIFVFMHGWKGDIPAAIDQYDRWISAMSQLPSDRALMEGKRPNGFRPVWIGLHWPSLPWGDEDLPAPVSFAAGAMDAVIEKYVDRLGGDDELREPLRIIVGRASEDAQPDEMPDDVKAAYADVNSVVGLLADGVGGAPDADRLAFDANEQYRTMKDATGVAFGGGIAATLLSPLNSLSFWTMKKRARNVGENGFHPLLADLSADLPDARLHLMGHSFGCIAASAATCGPEGSPAFDVASLVLVQGALSLWSYSGDMPPRPNTPGYFARLLSEGRVKGPIVTTRSKHDRAVGFFYPIAAGVAGQVAYATTAKLPEFGGVGAFGAQGLGSTAEDMKMLDKDGDYKMGDGRVLNLEAPEYICHGGGLSGAHSDIAGPQVAHAVWSAAIAA